MCGPRAQAHELQYKKIEELFYQSLNEIRKVRTCILNVTEFCWLEKILIFRRKIVDIDNMVIKLIHNIFQDILNVEEGCEALYAMKRFVLRERLHEILCYYWTKIWRLFENKLENVITCIDKNTLNPIMTACAGATTARMNNNYLTLQFNMLINTTDWFNDCPGQQYVDFIYYLFFF